MIIVSNKKERLTEFNQKNILEAAKKLFCEKGINQTTMDDIAKESQYSKSTIYVYFKSKEEIYNHIVFENMVLLRNGLTESIFSSAGFVGGYKAICYTLLTFYETYPLYFDSILGDISIEQDDFNKHPILLKIYEVGEEINHVMQKFIEEGISKKQVRPDINPLQTAFTLWASICGLISLACKKEKYIQKGMGVCKQDFLEYGFETLLHAILLVEEQSYGGLT